MSDRQSPDVVRLTGDEREHLLDFDYVAHGEPDEDDIVGRVEALLAARLAQAKADALLHYADACAVNPGECVSWSRDVAHDIREWVEMGFHLEPRTGDEKR